MTASGKRATAPDTELGLRSLRPEGPEARESHGAFCFGKKGRSALPAVRYAEKELPQPQVDLVLGLMNLKPAPAVVST